MKQTSFEKTEEGVVSATDTDSLRSRPEEGRSIVRLIDRRLLLTSAIVLTFCYVDRVLIPYANIAGMSQALQLKVGNRYALITLIFTVPYVVFQLPATLAVRYFGPRKFIATICFLWGIAVIGSGFVQTWQQLLSVRILLGLFESGLYPSLVYLVSTWYTREEIAKRYAGMYVLLWTSFGFAGITSYGISKIHTRSYEGWSWIFFINGSLTCLAAFYAYWMLVDFPEHAPKSWRFLNASQAKFVTNKIDEDRGDAVAGKIDFKQYFGSALDPKIWVIAFMSFLISTPANALGFYTPLILNGGFGFSVAKSQALSAPPFFLAAIVTWCSGWVSDKYQVSWAILLVSTLVEIAGFSLLGFEKNNSIRYFGVFLTQVGSSVNLPAIVTYQARNITGQWKRAFCSSVVVMSSGMGGIAGALIFRAQDAPNYYPGLYTCIGCDVLLLFLLWMLSLFLNSENKKQANGLLVIEKQPGFRYTL